MDRTSATARLLGFGCMRLSTAAATDEVAAIAVIHAALNAGARLLDTADVYAPDEEGIGHNERLVAAALATWNGPADSIQVASKGGLTRPGGRWAPDGRATHLRAACEASLSALGSPRIGLYQLHAVDPRTSFETSVRALAGLQRDGLIEHIGLCNVTVSQIRAARDIADITTVQVSLGPFDEENFRNGVAEYCRDEGLRLLAYRPLGGADRDRCAKDDTLNEIAREHGATPHDIALAWLLDLDECVVPLPGATRMATAAALETVPRITLTGRDRDRLDTRFPAGRLLRTSRAKRQPRQADGDVVIIMGMPGSGKSTLARGFVTQGYARLNRDERGGRLADLADSLDEGFGRGERRWVLDNTYPSRRSRNEIIECAWRHGAPVRCLRVGTSLADAQINAIRRILEAHGSLPSADELRSLGKQDHRFFGPDAQFRFERSVEEPTVEEGFESVETIDFSRDEDSRRDVRALVIDADALLANADGSAAGTLRIDDARREVMKKYHDAGWRILLTAWRPQIAKGAVTGSDVKAWFERLRALLGFEIATAFCPHPPGPPVCWCRKPVPGLVLEFLYRQSVALASVRFIGSSAADRTMASRLGGECFEIDDFVKGDVLP